MLEIRITGVYTPAVERQLTESTKESVASNSLIYILFDFRGADTTATSGELQIYNVTQDLRKHYPMVRKFAIVSSVRDNTDHVDKNFFEIVAHNRGVIAKVFTEYEPAKQWLLGSFEA